MPQEQKTANGHLLGAKADKLAPPKMHLQQNDMVVEDNVVYKKVLSTHSRVGESGGHSHLATRWVTARAGNL